MPQVRATSLPVPDGSIAKMPRPWQLSVALFVLGGLEILKAIRFHLDGASLALDMGPVAIAGGLLKVSDKPLQLDGSLMLRIGTFNLGAIGSYADLGGMPSLFIFAAFQQILGGPPYFVVAGLAFGFVLGTFTDFVEVEPGAAWLWVATLFYPFARLVLSFTSGLLSERMSHGSVLAFGFFGGAIGMAVPLVTQHPAGLAVTALMLGLLNGSVPVVSTASVSTVAVSAVVAMRCGWHPTTENEKPGYTRLCLRISPRIRRNQATSVRVGAGFSATLG